MYLAYDLKLLGRDGSAIRLHTETTSGAISETHDGLICADEEGVMIVDIASSTQTPVSWENTVSADAPSLCLCKCWCISTHLLYASANDFSDADAYIHTVVNST